jgi:hypothetical protein
MTDEGKERQMTEDTATVDETTEATASEDDEEREDDSGFRVMVGMFSLNELFGDAPDEVKEMLAKALEDAKLRRLAEEIKEWVTPDVADAVLYCYGDLDGTTEPSMADAAMINLMRVAHISDEHMLMHLNEVEHFHGYVIAIKFLAERGPQGLHILRRIAGLVPGESYDGSEKLPADVVKGVESHE